MHTREAHAWSQFATLSAVADVRAEAVLARAIWTARLERPDELRDIWPFTEGGWFYSRAVITAAAEASIELAIIVSIWPERPCDVLRASWE